MLLLIGTYARCRPVSKLTRVVRSNLVRAAKEFGLEAVDSDFNHSPELGIWDGKEFAFRVRHRWRYRWKY